MLIPIKTDTKQFFYACLDVLAPIIPLQKKEKQILSALMLVDYVNREKLLVRGFTPENIDLFMDKHLLSKEVRTAVRQSLSPPVSENSFNNKICFLREKRLLLNNRLSKELHKLYPQKSNGKLTLDINFKVTATA